LSRHNPLLINTKTTVTATLILRHIVYSIGVDRPSRARVRLMMQAVLGHVTVRCLHSSADGWISGLLRVVEPVVVVVVVVVVVDWPIGLIVSRCERLAFPSLSADQEGLSVP